MIRFNNVEQNPRIRLFQSDPFLREALLFARCGSHFIVFIENDTEIAVIDFFHARSDLPARIAMLTARDPS